MPVRSATTGLSASILTAVLLCCAACGSKEESEAAQPAARPVEIVQVSPSDLPVTFEFVGRTASSQKVEIRSRVSGFLDEIAYEEGAFVEKGDTLFLIDSDPFDAKLKAANAELAQQQARLDTAESLLNRIKPLAEAQAVAQKELDDATGQVRAAAAAVEEASARVFQAELDVSYTKILSPVAGLTSSASYREGAYLGFPSSPLTYVAQIDPIWVEFSISEAQYLRAKKASTSGSMIYPDENTFDVEVLLSDGSVHPQRGRISFSDVSVSDQTGTFLIRAEVPNPDGALLPGQYTRVVLHGAKRPGAIAVPLRAVRQGPRGAFVWVMDADNKAEQRPVMLGPWDDTGWVIEHGLKAGDRVVVDGSLALTPGTPLAVAGIAKFQITGKGEGAGK